MDSLLGRRKKSRKQRPGPSTEAPAAPTPPLPNQPTYYEDPNALEFDHMARMNRAHGYYNPYEYYDQQYYGTAPYQQQYTPPPPPVPDYHSGVMVPAPGYDHQQYESPPVTNYPQYPQGPPQYDPSQYESSSGTHYPQYPQGPPQYYDHGQYESSSTTNYPQHPRAAPQYAEYISDENPNGCMIM